MSERNERAAFVTDLNHKVDLLEAKLERLSKSAGPPQQKLAQPAGPPVDTVRIDAVLLQLGQRITNPFIFTVLQLFFPGPSLPGSAPPSDVVFSFPPFQVALDQVQRAASQQPQSPIAWVPPSPQKNGNKTRSHPRFQQGSWVCGYCCGRRG